MARGLDYDLNWSLAGDRVTARGEAYRNASVRDLIEFTPRAGHSVTKARGLVCAAPVPPPCPVFATEALPGTQARTHLYTQARARSRRKRGALARAPACLQFIHGAAHI